MVELESWNDRAHEFQENEKGLIRTNVVSILTCFAYKSVDDVSVLAWMDTSLACADVWMRLDGDSFIDVFAHDILENFFVRQRLAIFFDTT